MDSHDDCGCNLIFFHKVYFVWPRCSWGMPLSLSIVWRLEVVCISEIEICIHSLCYVGRYFSILEKLIASRNVLLSEILLYNTCNLLL